MLGKPSRASYLPVAGRQPPGRQRGMTTIGMIILVMFLGLFVFAILRLTPVYMNYMEIAGVVDGVYDEFDSQKPTRGAIRLSIRRRFGVESIDVIKHNNIQVNGVDGGFEVIADYDHTVPFIANVYFTVKFEKRATIRH